MAYSRRNRNSGRCGAGWPGVLAARLKAAALSLMLGPTAWASQAEPLAVDGQTAGTGEAMYLGAASCASSLCHGSVQPFEQSPILRKEYIIWQSDRHRNMHAKGYAKLLTDEAESIARKLGLGSPGEAPECLACHADPAPPERRGEKFQLSDGVSCEACHGPAGQYIDVHVEPGQSRAELIAHGLYPTWEPEARARLCLSCHLGGEDRFINHRILGAGHPRLSFELDTFTFLQPHHVVDADYIARKGEVDFVRDWAIGQGLAAIQHLDWLLDRERGWRGIFVEPALLDCHSCHRRLDADRWQARGSTGLGPGEMRLNDANLVLLRTIMTAIEPRAAQRLRALTQALHRATTEGVEETLAAAGRVKQELEAAVTMLADHRFAVEDLHVILNELDRQAVAGELRDFAAAEQAVMAAVNLILAFERNGVLEKDDIEADIDRLYDAVADAYAYSDRELASALQALVARIKAPPG